MSRWTCVPLDSPGALPCVPGVTSETLLKLCPRASAWPTRTVSRVNAGWGAPWGPWEPPPTTRRPSLSQMLGYCPTASLKTQQAASPTQDQRVPFQDSQREPVFLRGWTEAGAGDRALRLDFPCPRGYGLSQVPSGSLSCLSTSTLGGLAWVGPVLVFARFRVGSHHSASGRLQPCPWGGLWVADRTPTGWGE